MNNGMRKNKSDNRRVIKTVNLMSQVFVTFNYSNEYN